MLGIQLNGVFKAYPFDELNQLDVSRFDDLVGERSISVHWDALSQSAFATDAAVRLTVNEQALRKAALDTAGARATGRKS